MTVPIASLNGQAHRLAVWQDLKATALTFGVETEHSALSRRVGWPPCQNERAGKRARFRRWLVVLEPVQSTHAGCQLWRSVRSVGC